MKGNKNTAGLMLGSVIFAASQMVYAAEMNHHNHGNMGKMKGMDHSAHSGHATESSTHLHHKHGKGQFMFEYRLMRMEMDGLLSGTRDVQTQDVSSALMGSMPMAGPLAGFDYRMAPTNMTMDMHMLMGMYGVSERLTLMGMVNYVSNDMDMVMHMRMMSTGPIMNSMASSMSTSGVGDSVLTAMYSASDKWTASVGLSIPTGGIDERVMMAGMDMQAPYAMQLGSGTYDLMPSVTYQITNGHISWGAQATYTAHLGDNDNGYTLGDKFELVVWGKSRLHSGTTVGYRIALNDWDGISGRDSNIPMMMKMMAPTTDEANSGGRRVDFAIGASKYFGGHMIGAEVGVPLTQNLDGVQMKTESIVSVAYQYAM